MKQSSKLLMQSTPTTVAMRNLELLPKRLKTVLFHWHWANGAYFVE